MEMISAFESTGLNWQLARFDEPAELLAAQLGDPSVGLGLNAESRKVEAFGERLLLAHMLGGSVDLRHHGNGAPYMANDTRRISISHSKRYIAVASHPSRQVGIDVEVNTNRAERLHQRFMRDDELLSAPSDWQLREKALAAWCAKEAAYKCLPVEGCDFLQDMRAEFSDGRIAVDYQGRRFVFDWRMTAQYCLVVGGEGIFGE